MISITLLKNNIKESKNENIVIRGVYCDVLYTLAIPVKRLEKAIRKYQPHNLSLKKIISYSDPTVYYRESNNSFIKERFWMRIFSSFISKDLSEMTSDELECYMSLDGYEKCDSLKTFLKRKDDENGEKP